MQVARRAPQLLAESTGLVREFYRSQFAPDGTVCNRGGRPDLYYALFAIVGAQSLDVPIPLEKTTLWLRSFGDGAALDFIHLGALARCWAALGRDHMPSGIDRALGARLQEFRKSDGGYDGDKGLPHGTAYGAFVALGAYQDLGLTPPHPLDLIRSLNQLKTADGAWSNIPGLPAGAVNATAGVVTIMRNLGLPVHLSVGGWLLAQQHPSGGFLAAPGAPIPDLLSTATALHALACLDRHLNSEAHGRCLDFVDSLWSAQGGFHGHWADDHLDAEYTFYGLLALGHLSL